MKIFCTFILTVTVAIVVERFRAEFLLVEVDDPALKGKFCFLFQYLINQRCLVNEYFTMSLANVYS